MPALSDRSRRFWVLLLGIAVVGWLWRVVYLVWMHDLPVLDDGAGYHLTAIDVASGNGFVNPLGPGNPYAQHPPAWVLLLSLPSALGAKSLLAHQLTAAAVGTATVVMAGLAGRSAFGKRVGLIAAGVTALYANMWVLERELLSETLVYLGMATLIFLVYRFRERPGLAGAALLGLACGVLILTRAELLLVAPFIVLPVVIGRRRFGWSQRIGWLLLAGTMCLLVVAPWSYYNSTRFEHFVPVSYGLGGTLATGNTETTYHGPLIGYFDNAGLAKDVPGDSSEAEVVNRHQALDFMGDNASEVPKVVYARLGRTFGFYRPLQQVDLEATRASEKWVYTLALLEYLVLVPLAIGGVVLARRRRIPVYPLLMPAVIVILATAFTVGQPRYRSAFEIPLVLLAAVSLEWFSRRLLPAWRRTDEPAPQGAYV